MGFHETEFRARYGETDQMGIIYHPNYYVYFENGRTEYLRSLGMCYREMEEQGVMLPLTETHCKYRTPARYDDELIVRTEVADMTVARIAFGYKLVRKHDNALLAEGQTVHGFVNSANRPVNLKKVNKALYDRLLEELSKK